MKDVLNLTSSPDSGGHIILLCAGLRSAMYLCAVVVHSQHAEHVQGVSTLDELPHSVGQDALASLLWGGGLVSGWTGQLIHADDAVLGVY